MTKPSKQSKIDKQRPANGANNNSVINAGALVEGVEAERKGELPAKRVQTVRRAKHFHDQILVHAKSEFVQGNLFAQLLDETKRKLAADGVVEDKLITPGITLTDTEHKIVDCITVFQGTKSNNIYNIEDKDTFYSGNVDAVPALYGGNNQTAIAPVLRFKPSELYEAYTGTKNYSGRDIQHIKTVFENLSRKHFLIQYSRTSRGKSADITQTIEEYMPLFRILKYTEEIKHKTKDGADDYTERKEEILIKLNPIWKHQIENWYVDMPVNITALTKKAVGRADYPECINLLRDALLQDFKKNIKREYNYETLIYLLKLDNYLKQSRKKLIKERIDQSIKAVIDMGLITNVEEVAGAKGQKKVVFYFNKDFLRQNPGN